MQAGCDRTFRYAWIIYPLQTLCLLFFF